MSGNKTLLAFSLSIYAQVLQYTLKDLLFSEDFYQRFDRQVSTIDSTTTRLCKARGRLVLLMQDLTFLGKLDFRIVHKNGY